MGSNTLATGAAGMFFGAALTASDVYRQSVIVSQMRLEDFHMLKVFLVASGSSAAVMTLFEKLGLYKRKARSPSGINLFSSYDANIIGGLMIGAGMTLAGACPGTVLAQVSTGASPGRFALAGGIFGGVLYSRISPYLRRHQLLDEDLADDKITIHGKLGITSDQAVLVFELACLTIVVLAAFLGPERNTAFMHPVIGGLLIGGAQAISLLLTGNAVGVSTAYGEFGKLFWNLWDRRGGPASAGGARPWSRSLVFALGILSGSWLLATLVPVTAAPRELQVSPAAAAIGGGVMVVGARLANGCTSGHGISGLPLLSVSSAVTVASMFAGGIGLAMLGRL